MRSQLRRRTRDAAVVSRRLLVADARCQVGRPADRAQGDRSRLEARPKDDEAIRPKQCNKVVETGFGQNRRSRTSAVCGLSEHVPLWTRLSRQKRPLPPLCRPVCVSPSHFGYSSGMRTRWRSSTHSRSPDAMDARSRPCAGRCGIVAALRGGSPSFSIEPLPRLALTSGRPATHHHPNPATGSGGNELHERRQETKDREARQRDMAAGRPPRWPG